MTETGAATYKEAAQKTNVAGIYRDYYEEMEKGNKGCESVVQAYLRSTKQHIDNWIDPKEESTVGFTKGIGNKTLSELMTAEVIKLRNEMRDASAGVVTTRRVLGTLSHILKYGVETDKIGINVAKGVISKRDEAGERVTPPMKAARAIILKKSDEKLALRTKFAASSGLRAYEQCALRWMHLDLKKAVSRSKRVWMHMVSLTRQSHLQGVALFQSARR